MQTEEIYRTAEEVSERYHTPVQTLYRWRMTGAGPKAIKVGRKLLYPESGIREWLQSLEDQEALRKPA